MKEKIPWKVISKVLSGTAGSADEKAFDEWIASSNEHFDLYNKIKEIWQESGHIPMDFNPNAPKALKKVKTYLNHGNQLNLIPSYLMRIAATVILFLGISGVLFFISGKLGVKNLQYSTLDNKINLILPDGSHIWLNENSKLISPVKFNKIRKVSLKGEAYFEVAKDPKKPFIIEANGSETKVLGTHFTIRSYQNKKEVSVIVSEGRVAFSGNKSKDKIILGPGDMGIFSISNNELKKLKNDDVNFLAWKTNEYIFENKPLENIIRTIADQYHISYEFRDTCLMKYRVNVTFKQKSPEEIMKILSLTLDIKIELQNKNLKISNNN